LERKAGDLGSGGDSDGPEFNGDRSAPVDERDFERILSGEAGFATNKIEPTVSKLLLTVFGKLVDELSFSGDDSSG
jgi:hypothetical protein